MTKPSKLDKFLKWVKSFIKLWQYYFPCDRILAQRIFKATVNSTLAFIFTLIPEVRQHLGTEPAMLPLISVIVHPGRRVSGTIQGAIYCTTGLIFGLAYSIFGRFLAQQCMGSSWSVLTEVEQYKQNFRGFEAGLAILAVFETIMLFVHGWMRSVSHHYFGIAFPLFLVTHFAFMANLQESSGVIANSFATPFYLGIAMSIFWNLTLFPEFGSTYLGTTTVNALNEIHKDIDDSINFFVSVNSCPLAADSKSRDSEDLGEKPLYKKPITTLSKLLKYKTQIGKYLNNCEAVLLECIYEISYSYVSPTSLENPLALFKDLSIFVNGIINACQLEFILLGRSENLTDVSLGVNLDKEISYADSKKLVLILKPLKLPIFNLHHILSETMYKINVSLAYCYDVDLSNVFYPDSFAELNIDKVTKISEITENYNNFEENISTLENAAEEFSVSFREQLLKYNKYSIDPSDEMFLLSSFLMNFKETISTVTKLARQTEEVYQFRKKQEKKGWIRGKTLWFNFMSNFASFRQWLLGNSLSVTEGEYLGGVIHGNVFEQGPELVNRRPDFEENNLLGQKIDEYLVLDDEDNNFKLPFSHVPTQARPEPSLKMLTPGNYVHWIKSSMIMANNFYKRSKNHFRFGFQVAVALQLASFPMFVPKLRHWYISYRGPWIGFVCILCLEPSVGGTFWVFFLRAVGVVLGALWGLVSYYAGVNQTNPYLETVITLFGAVPGFYFLLGTPYVKAAIIEIISIYIVILAAILPTWIPSEIQVSFAKRCLAVGYGGTIALIVQVVIFPIKARDQLNEEISFICGCTSEMVSLYASGLEGGNLKESLTVERYNRIVNISRSAKAALDRAQAYNGLTRQEPRLKGEFTELEKIFSQVIFIQRQIIERLDTATLLRKQYGSAVLEELNVVIYPYRRQMIGSVTSLMREIQEAYINKTPLPQFSPSARIAHRRVVNKVRVTLEIKYPSKTSSRVISRINSKHVGGTLEMTPNIVKEENESDISDEEGEEILIRPNAQLERSKLRYEQNNNIFPKMNSVSRQEVAQHEFYLCEKLLAWNASSAAFEEIIEYIEELLHLTKIIVGVNEFKYGFLSRPLYEDWVTEAITGFNDFINQNQKLNDNQKLNTSIDFNKSSSKSHHNSTESLGPDAITDSQSTYSETPVQSLGSGSLDSESVDSNEGPVAYNTDDPQYKRRPSLNLAMIASHKINQGETVPTKFRDRLNSLASGNFAWNDLNKEKTLGDADSVFGNDNSSEDSDEDLPLALKMVVSRMRKKD